MTEYRFDSAPIKTWHKTPEGYLEFVAPIACEGWLTYFDKSGKKREEFVSRQTLTDSVHTFIRKPITKHHPEEPVTALNAKKYAVGWTANGAKMDDRGVLWLQGTVFDAETIDSIESGETKEISCGYKVRTQKRGDGWEQVFREGNHVAAVDRGRAGPDVAFQIDSAEDQAYWCNDAIVDADDLEIPEVNPPPLKQSDPKQTKPPTEKKKMKVVLDGLEIEVGSMDEAKHVRAADAALTKARNSADSLTAKLELETGKTQKLTVDHKAATEQVSALTTQLDDANSRYDSLKLDYDEIAEGGDRGDGAGVDIRADKISQMIADRMGLWTQVLPFMRSDNPDFKPDFALDPIGIMATAVKAANPHLADQLDGLDLKTDSAQGFVKGLFLALDATKTEQKTRTTVDGMFADIFQGRSKMRTNTDGKRDDAQMEKIRQGYRDAHKS